VRTVVIRKDCSRLQWRDRSGFKPDSLLPQRGTHTLDLC